MLFYNAGRKALLTRFSVLYFWEKKPDIDRFCSRFFPIDDCGVGSEIVKSKKIFCKRGPIFRIFPFEKPAAMEYNKDIE